MNLSRRSFLKGLGAVVASTALPSVSFASGVDLRQSFPRYIASLTGNPENVSDVHFRYRIGATGIPEYKIYTREHGTAIQLKKDFDLRFLNAMLKRDTGYELNELALKQLNQIVPGDYRMASVPNLPAGSFDLVFRLLHANKSNQISFA